MIKTTLGALVDCASTQTPDGMTMPGPLDRLMAMQLPIKTSWKLKDVIRAVTPKFERFAQERNNLYKKHGEQNPENPEEYRLVNQEQVDAFNDEFLALRDIELEVDVEPFKLSDFLASTALAATDLMKLEWLLAPGDQIRVAVAGGEPVLEQTAKGLNG